VILLAFYVCLKLVRIARKLLGDIGRQSQQTIFWVNLENDVSKLASALGGLRKKTRQDIPPEVHAMEERVPLHHHDHSSQKHQPEQGLGLYDETNEPLYREHSNQTLNDNIDAPLIPSEQGNWPSTISGRQAHGTSRLVARPDSAHLLPLDTNSLHLLPADSGLVRRTPTFPQQGSDD